MSKKISLILGIIIILGLGVGGFFWWKKTHNPKTNNQSKTEETPVVNLKDAVFTEVVPVEPGQYENDSDLDGIPNTKEQELGTNSNATDSDGDGLDDKDEIEVWKTDPLKRDSDGDGFADGYEVLQGYKPNGPGKIDE